VTTPGVLGVDLSLTGTGLANSLGWSATLKPPAKLRDVARIEWIRNAIVLDHLTGVDLVVIEGPSYGSARQAQSGHHERAGLWWVVVRSLWRRGVSYAVVSPKGRAKYATGNGNAGKDDVIREVTRRFDWFEGDNNQADALVLAAMGADHLGVPMVTMPQIHRVALDAVAWPEMVGAAA
jgi:crossover junction endodeoxyribonuclease RuvC